MLNSSYVSKWMRCRESLTPPDPSQKERLDPQKLSSVFRIHAVGCVCLHPHTCNNSKQSRETWDEILIIAYTIKMCSSPCVRAVREEIYVINAVADDTPDSLGIILGSGHALDSLIEFKKFPGPWLISWRL